MGKCCWAISWDHQFRVYAVRLEEQRGGAVRLLEYKSDTIGRKRLGERIRALLGTIELEEDELLAIGGYLPECVVIERTLPPLTGKNMEEALEFELAGCVPESVSNLAYTFRVIGTLEDGRLRVRIMAMNRDKLEGLYCELRAAGVRADIFWHSFMAVGSEFDSEEIFLPFVEPDCVLKPVNSSGLREVAMMTGFAASPQITNVADLAGKLHIERTELPLSGAYPSSILLGTALLKNVNKRGAEGAFLPPELLRRRFRKFRHNIVYLSVMCMIVLVALMVKGWIQERDLIVETDENIRATEQLLSTIHLEREILNRRQLILRKFCENLTADSEILSFLYRLTSVLPSNMYATGFACAGGRMSMTIIYTGERMELLNLLGSIQNYKLAEDTKTTQNSDNKTSTAQVVWNRATGVGGEK